MAKYNEADHPRNSKGEYADKSGSSRPGALPEQSKASKAIGKVVEQLDNGGSLSVADRVFLSRRADKEFVQAAYAANRPELDWGISQNPNLPEDQLDELVYRQPDETWEQYIRAGICMRQNMSPDLQEWTESWTRKDSGLSAETRKTCAINLIQNQHSKPETINRLLQQYPGEEAANWAVYNPTCNDQTLALAVSHTRSENSVGYAMRNPSCGPATLHQILGRKPYDPYHVQDVFSHPGLDKETLSDWKNHCSQDDDAAALGAASNPNMTSDIAENLHEYGSNDVDRRLCRNPNTPDHLLAEFTEWGDPTADLQLARNPHIGEQRARTILDRHMTDEFHLEALRDNESLPQSMRDEAGLLYERQHSIR